jgi:hypothetical protein
MEAFVHLMVPAERTVSVLIAYLRMSYFIETDAARFREVEGEKTTKQEE